MKILPNNKEVLCKILILEYLKQGNKFENEINTFEKIMKLKKETAKKLQNIDPNIDNFSFNFIQNTLIEIIIHYHPINEMKIIKL